MNALSDILGFELRQRMRLLSTHVYFLIFLSLTMLWIAAAGGMLNGATVSFGSKVWLNSAYVLGQTISFLGCFGCIIVAAMMGRAVQQDFEYRIHDFFFSAPINKYAYLGGRYLAAALTLGYIFLSIPLGAWLGSLLPGIDPESLGPQHLSTYLLPYLVSMLPNILTLGAMFFILAAYSRRMLPVYVCGVLLVTGYLASMSLGRDAEFRQIAAMLDPFGSRALSRLTEYWTIHEKNTRPLLLEGIYLYNRLLWAAIGLLCLALGAWRFRMEAKTSVSPRKDEAAVPAPARLVQHAPDFSHFRARSLLLPLTWLNLRETIKNIYFGVIVLCGVLFMMFVGQQIGKMYGTPLWPVTYNVLDLMAGLFGLFILIITTFYSGELVWREREAGIALMHDALPLPNWLFLLPKLLALILMQGLLLLVVMLCGILLQISQGYYHIELSQYLLRLFVLQWPSYILLAVLSVTVQVVVNQKYLGFFLMILYYIISSFGSLIGLEHPMLIFGHLPEIPYSDMNGYGSQLPHFAWYLAYWSGMGLLLLGAALLLWPRGSNDNWSTRRLLARRQLSPRILSLLGSGLALFLCCGGVLFYYTNILNDYQSSFEQEEEQASYERRYKRLEGRPQPRITDVRLKIDLEPAKRSMQIAGSYLLQNRSGRPLHEIYLQLPGREKIQKIAFNHPVKAQISDQRLGFYSYRLDEPLQANDTLQLDFAYDFAPKGLLGLGSDTPVIGNGTFINNMLLPHLGYQPMGELSEERARKKHGLPPRERMLARDDPRGLQDNMISNDADWVSYEAIVSTSPDQIAISPGYLQKEWVANGRRYFHYKMDRPILNFYSFQSARYAVRQEKWHDLPLEIYYQPGHEYNLQRMFAGMQDGLDYFTSQFGPYQHKQLRIIEFPRYSTFAQSFPNTIPFSEGIGFIARVKGEDEKEIDYPYYVTAHEVAHQWWAHQVVPANTRGATAMVETLAQYSALMVMKKKYGTPAMQRFLRYELDRYLAGRATESRKELPLGHNENQNYIHYNKGSLIMYQLQDMLGEDKVNGALRALEEELRKIAPAELQYLITDGFEQIVLYENRALSAQAKPLADGQYEVTLKYAASKVRADESGKESPLPMQDLIEFGVNGENDKPLLRQRFWIKASGEQTLRLVVKGKPVKAGIDPDNKLIDRRPDDNLSRVELP